MNRSGLIITVVALLVGGVLGYLIKDTNVIQEVDVSKYEYENQIQQLEFEAKVAKIEVQYLENLHFLEDADSTELDSIWLNHGF
jgi:Flp pilus assembly protein CpaB